MVATHFSFGALRWISKPFGSAPQMVTSISSNKNGTSRIEEDFACGDPDGSGQNTSGSAMLAQAAGDCRCGLGLFTLWKDDRPTHNARFSFLVCSEHLVHPVFGRTNWLFNSLRPTPRLTAPRRWESRYWPRLRRSHPTEETMCVEHRRIAVGLSLSLVCFKFTKMPTLK